jgi:hypothetical protein
LQILQPYQNINGKGHAEDNLDKDKSFDAWPGAAISMSTALVPQLAACYILHPAIVRSWQLKMVAWKLHKLGCD